MAEYERDERKYANKGWAALNTVLGSIGAAGATGILNNLFPAAGNCPENAMINRYESALQAKIAELETEVKLRDSYTFTMGEVGKFRDYVETRLSAVEKELCEQKVFNATCISNMSCISNQVAQLMALTKMVIPITNVCPQPAVATTTA